MSHSKAIVTLAIGKRYKKNWERLCRSNWQRYAEKHGYDLICIDQPLDLSERAQNRSPAWQKCLVLSQEFSGQYEQIAWVDSDILINYSIAPCIFKETPVEKVGAVADWASPLPQLFLQTMQRRNEYFDYVGIDFVDDPAPEYYYKNYGLPAVHEIVHTGVMIFSPQHHRELLEQVYYGYEDKGSAEWNYEARPLSWELIKADCVHWIDHRFNLIWIEYLCLHYPFLLKKKAPKPLRQFQEKLQRASGDLDLPVRPSLRKRCADAAFLNSFFLHFAGCGQDMSLVNTHLSSWKELV
jgi:hypothetical protein